MKTEGILVGDLSASLPSLMTAVMETKSAFANHDASGNWVRVEAITGQCTPGTVKDPNCAGKPSTSGQNKQQSNTVAPTNSSASITDEQMVGFILGS
jgi:hypothetical protein